MPSFEWIYADNSELFKTDYNFYSVNYKSWIEDAVSIYQETENVLKRQYRETDYQKRTHSGKCIPYGL